MTAPNDPLPAALLGRAHGRIKGGQHLKYPALSIATAATTTLLDAAEAGDRATALGLLAKGANPNAPAADGTTAIMWAASNDDIELVRGLIKAGAQR